MRWKFWQRRPQWQTESGWYTAPIMDTFDRPTGPAWDSRLAADWWAEWLALGGTEPPPEWQTERGD